MKHNDIRLVALDLDGTVFRDDKTISQKTQSAIAKAIAQGVVVIPATGRPLSGLPAEFAQMDGVEYALTGNGAAIWRLKDRQKLVSLPFSTQDTLRAIALMEQFDCMVDVYFDGKVYTSPESLAKAERFAPPEMLEYVRKTRNTVPNLKEHIAKNSLQAEKVTMFFAQESERQAAIAAAQREDWIEPSSSVPNNLELNAAGVNKGNGLKQLADVLKIEISQVMACGDGGNDIAMLKAAGLGVAMANAPESVKQAADAVTDSNQKDGVAKAIEKYVL